MNKCHLLITISLIVLGVSHFALHSDVSAQQKLAQTGFQFLSVGTDARATAMGEAVTTVEGSSMSLFYNPAGIARLTSSFTFTASRMNWIADISYYSGSLAIRPDNGKYGVVGLSFNFVDYGEIIGTVVAPTEEGFLETGDISPSAFFVGLGYAKALTDRFSVGGQIKYVSQSLGTPFVPETDTTLQKIDLSEDVLAFDFGTIYLTGFKSLAFGMSVRNFSKEIRYVREGFQLPLTFKIGFSIDALDFLASGHESQSFIISFDAVHPRSFPEFFSLGGEYRLTDAFTIRAGYVYNQDDYSATAGFGIKTYKLAFDYSYTPFDVFRDIHRLSIRFSL